MVKMNEKMKELLKREGGESQINISELCKSIILKTKCINDCVLYDETGNLEKKKINWEFVLKINKDWTGYEVSHNEILIPDVIFFKDNIVTFLEEIRAQLKIKYPNKIFCLVLSYSDRGVLRFHTYRPIEGLWLSPEIERYKEPILFDL